MIYGEDECVFESTGKKAYCYRRFTSVVATDAEFHGLYGSDGGEELEPEEVIELVDDQIRYLLDIQKKAVACIAARQDDLERAVMDHRRA